MMRRHEDWENRLNTVIEWHWAAPFRYGRSDCFAFPVDAIEAVTGETVFDYRQYRTEQGAARLLRRHGFETVADAFASRFETVPVSLAGRGDIGVVRRAGKRSAAVPGRAAEPPGQGVTSGGVFTGLGFLTRGEAGLIAVPRADIDAAFKVA